MTATLSLYSEDKIEVTINKSGEKAFTVIHLGDITIFMPEWGKETIPFLQSLVEQTVLAIESLKRLGDENE